MKEKVKENFVNILININIFEGEYLNGKRWNRMEKEKKFFKI